MANQIPIDPTLCLYTPPPPPTHADGPPLDQQELMQRIARARAGLNKQQSSVRGIITRELQHYQQEYIQNLTLLASVFVQDALDNVVEARPLFMIAASHCMNRVIVYTRMMGKSKCVDWISPITSALLFAQAYLPIESVSSKTDDDNGKYNWITTTDKLTASRCLALSNLFKKLQDDHGALGKDDPDGIKSVKRKLTAMVIFWKAAAYIRCGDVGYTAAEAQSSQLTIDERYQHLTDAHRYYKCAVKLLLTHVFLKKKHTPAQTQFLAVLEKRSRDIIARRAELFFGLSNKNEHTAHNAGFSEEKDLSDLILPEPDVLQLPHDFFFTWFNTELQTTWDAIQAMESPSSPGMTSVVIAPRTVVNNSSAPSLLLDDDDDNDASGDTMPSITSNMDIYINKHMTNLLTSRLTQFLSNHPSLQRFAMIAATCATLQERRRVLTHPNAILYLPLDTANIANDVKNIDAALVKLEDAIVDMIRSEDIISTTTKKNNSPIDKK